MEQHTHSSHGTKYLVERLDGKPIPEDEPLFVLRAQDKYAAVAIRYYAYLYRIGGDPDDIPTSDPLDEPARWEMWRHILSIAEAFEAWPLKKVPD